MWHSSPAEAIGFQLGIAEWLVRYYPPNEGEYRRLLIPLNADYWRHVVTQRRAALQIPDITAAAIESACAAEERERLVAILSGAALRFQIRGASEVLDRLRNDSPGH